MHDKERDVIAAIASAHGQGAIGVVRLSGAEVLRVVEKIFSQGKNFDAENFAQKNSYEEILARKNFNEEILAQKNSYEEKKFSGFPVHKMKSHKMYYGKIFRRAETIDEVLLCYMKSPRSFTGEDSVEIFCHGGMFVVSEVLATVLENGARPAEPGEFTKRAFLNGRINLAQAEAVMDLICAKNGAARRAALRQLGGGLSARVERVRDKILTWLAHIELSIDYPEHEDEARNSAEILREIDAVLFDLLALNETAKIGRVIREGVRTAIIGRPNVGKSTLLNAILHENRAIVHETAGTTRDVLTEEIRVGDVPLVITDTAGLRETADPIEKIGIEKTRETARDAELILYVADATCGFTHDDAAIVKNFSHAKIIILMNKSDLKNPQENAILASEAQNNLRDGDDNFCDCDENFLPDDSEKTNEHAAESKKHHAILASEAQNNLRDGDGKFCDCHENFLPISAKTGDGLDLLFAKIREIFLAGSGEFSGGETDIITRERHKMLLSQAIFHTEKAMHELRDGVPEDLVSVSLRAAYIALGEILGAEIGDDIVDRIFAEFCVGK
ncbi:MAG: tRNA uridine-5-carboxymethylaminomethyl(34) synthesis GTPase MnmE [Defluviitaleaceae bacterium]|nr:tRNA uridine-5-carboxymethylaminomethyl(34) synthesis GTPase MnmE [Defluviitaleaceae bacterium]